MPSTTSDYPDKNPMILPKGLKGSYKLDPSQPFINTNYKKKKDAFEWVYSDEPHATRRREILKQYPEIRKLFEPEIKTFYIVVAVTLSQLWIASWIGDASWSTFLLIMYVYGATVNHALQLANHEISHNGVFKDNLNANFFLGIFANIATGVPSSVTFRYYHMDHHIYQGVDVIDTDIPCAWELRTFTTTWKKLLWMTCQSVAYAFRPFYVNPKPLTKWQVINAIIIILCDLVIYSKCGLWGLLYLVFGSLMGVGLHPAAGHFIAEHYVFVKGYETYSYYGLLNYVNFNVGYHNEHHDFPKIPWSRLPEVRKIAPEWYDHLPHHDSYIKVIWKYITDDSMGPWSRVKRKTCSKFKKKNRPIHHVVAD
jgi:sphingolipid delta-4 desaturase